MLGVGRDETQTDDTFRAHMRKALGESDEVKGVDDELWQELCERLFFVSADLTNAEDYAVVGDAARRDRERRDRAEERNRLFYLAVPPSVFEPIVRNLSKSGLAPRTRTADERPWYRVVVEKPFGRSLESAQQLNDLVLGPVRRASDVSHRSLSGQGDRSERARAPLRELDLRAAVESPVDSARADHGGGDGRRRGARQVLRGSGRRSRHVPEPPAAAADAHGDGAAAADVGQRGARREGEGAASRFVG